MRFMQRINQAGGANATAFQGKRSAHARGVRLVPRVREEARHIRAHQTDLGDERSAHRGRYRRAPAFGLEPARELTDVAYRTPERASAARPAHHLRAAESASCATE